eukprot:m.125316 g.125316  ORF g.125316 m.125316 type:complete len:74 (-) comp11163_c0_seq2:3392-3613(-)
MRSYSVTQTHALLLLRCVRLNVSIPYKCHKVVCALCRESKLKRVDENVVSSRVVECRAVSQGWPPKQASYNRT